MDGGYSSIRDILYRRATHLVWLDYERPVIMAVWFADLSSEPFCAPIYGPASGTVSSGATCCGRATQSDGLGTPGTGRRQETAERLRKAEAHLVVLRLRHPREPWQAVELS